jgi:hypothetical protein
MTSIEWLVKELYTEMNMSGDGRVLDEILEEAKEMHKQEIIDAWNDGEYDYFYSKENGKDFADGNEYYQEKYGNNQLQLSNRGNILVDQKIESYVELKPKKD